MSAIFETDGINGDLGLDRVRRYKTRCKILVHSHLKDKPIEIYDAVYSVDIQKAIKNPGVATFTLTPIQNFLNLIFPNDVVNIYFDIGDNSGWTRTFFGYVDRVEENYKVDGDGKPKTYYRVVCTDFSKAFEKTEIYFNPQLAGRPDFAGYEFAKTNVDGLALLSKGLVFGGSPSDVIENIILILLGFGTQFRLPTSYTADATRQRLRERRAEIVRGQLPPELGIKKGSMISQYEKWKADREKELTGGIKKFFQEEDVEKRARNIAKEYGALGVLPEQVTGSETQVVAVLSSHFLADKLSGGEGISTAGTSRALGARRAFLIESISNDATALVDVVDIFTFIERRALDGFILGKPVWQETGTLMSLIRQFSNEMVNELFLDLRPVNLGDDQKSVHSDPVSGEFARLVDDAAGNISDNKVKNGITYIPAVVMREYPFSVIDGVDLSSVKLSIEDPETDKGLGYMPFGAIFAAGRNKPGRHIVNIQNINLSDYAKGESQKIAQKHIDVAVISEEEIKRTTLGRSDNDHFNLFEMYSDSLLGTDQKFYMKDFLPIITPIHIIRGGLRLRTVTTTAARFSLAAVKKLIIGTEPAGNVTSAVGSEVPSTEQKPVSPVLNIGSGVFFSPTQHLSNFNYRLKKPSSNQSTWFWRWHHGVDITQSGSGTGRKFVPKNKDYTPIPVRAIADGEVYVSAPDGVFAGYGNVVVIRHHWFGQYYVYSVYAHLSSREKGTSLNVPKGNENRRQFCCAKGMSGVNAGQMRPVPVKQGDIIGYLGRSGTKTSRPHLHFEIVVHWPGARIQGKNGFTPDIKYLDEETMTTTSPGGPQKTLVDHPFVASIPFGQTSFDPVKFYSYFGENLASLIGDTSTSDEAGEQEDDRLGAFDRDQDEVRSKDTAEVKDEAEEDTKAATKIVSRDSVDTASSRKQLIRWAVLQDHWYQHNLEYLSGRIEMRGAPEIRVGYRLDIRERNLSFYVESVQHSWNFPKNMTTSISVSRGQPNNPFPMYVLPPSTNNLEVPESQRRTSHSRLGKYFLTPDPIAIRRSLFLRSSGRIERDPGWSTADSLQRSKEVGDAWKNHVDEAPNAATDDKTGITTLTAKDDFEEKVILAGTRVTPSDSERAGETDDDPNSRLDTISNTNPVPGKTK